MCRRIFRIVAICMIVFTLAGVSGAQASGIGGGPYAPRPVHTGPIEPLPRVSASSAAEDPNGAVHAQAIALGKPGTVFRFDKTIGTTTQGFKQDDDHVYGVTSLITDSAGNIYTVEEYAARVVKYNPDGDVLHAVGGGAFHEWDAAHLNFPRDLALDTDGNVFVANENGIVKFDGDFNYVYSFPENWWDPENGVPYMAELRGIAIDSNQRMYLVDSGRNVIRVYHFDGEGYPVYETSIGQEDTPGDGNNQFDRPMQIAIDNDNNLYITEFNNNRVQKCEPNDSNTAWSCSPFLDEGLSLPYGLGFNPAKTLLYITDNANGRVLACPLLDDPTCTNFIHDINWPTDLVFSPDGMTIYLSLENNQVIKVYDVFGADDGIFKGVYNEPYLTDTNHFNGPFGVETDAKGNLYVIERWGQRMIKYDPTGNVLWKFGVPGIKSWEVGDNATMMDGPLALAVDPNGQKVYVADESNRVKIYSALTGQYLSTFGDGQGTGDKNFDYPRGIAFDSAGNLYVSDSNNQRVMVYDKNLNYVRKIGVTGQPGRASDHFAYPAGIALDKSGALYVADHDNCRVQKFDKKGKFLMSFGTGRCGEDYDRMNAPSDVAVDAKGLVYVADEWFNGVRVYAANGAFLTTIAGTWGDGTGDLRRPMGVTVDARGAVYVVDWRNNRVQKFLPGVPYAAQIALPGFGDRNNNSISSVAMFKNQLYVGTQNYTEGAQLWRQVGATWQKVVDRGFGYGEISYIGSLMEYKGYLYAATAPAKIFRSQDGETWEIVTEDDFGRQRAFGFDFLDPMAGGTKICARSAEWGGMNGAEVFCSDSGDTDTWSAFITDGHGNPNNNTIPGWIEYKGVQYLTFFNPTDGGSVYRRTNGDLVNITPTDIDGDVIGFEDFAIFNGSLYVSTAHRPADEVAPGQAHGSALYRCSLCDGSDWTRLDNNGFGNPKNTSLSNLMVFKNVLYALLENETEGVAIYKSTNGTTWTPLITKGFDTYHNWASYWNSSLLVTKTNLIVGVNNGIFGAGLWKVCPTTAACK